MENAHVLEKLYVKLVEVNKELIQIWLSDIVFSWRWWLEVSLTVIPWVLWFIFGDKKNKGRYLFIAMFVAAFTNFLDSIGIDYGLWHYDWKILPFLTAYLPWDYSLFPVYIMALINWRQHTHIVLKALIFSITSAFIYEPIFEKISIYHITKWNNFYSFPIYFLLFFLCYKLFESKVLWGESS